MSKETRKSQLKTLLALTLTAFVALSCQAATAADAVALGSAGSQSSNSQSTTTQTDDQTVTVLQMGLAQIAEDFNYVNGIMQDFSTGNITAREAMTATTSIMVLTDQTLDIVQSVQPSDQYTDCYTSTMNSLVWLMNYERYMAKYFQTDESSYGLQGWESYNQTIYYYNLSMSQPPMSQ